MAQDRVDLDGAIAAVEDCIRSTRRADTGRLRALEAGIPGRVADLPYKIKLAHSVVTITVATRDFTQDELPPVTFDIESWETLLSWLLTIRSKRDCL